MPERMRIPLRYSTKLILNDATSADANIRFRPSSIYDVDPTVGGSSYYGFTEISAFYHKYKVFKSKLTIMGANRDAEAHTVYILPISTDPGANVSDPARYYMNPLSKKRVVGSYQAVSTFKLSKSATTQSLSGVTTAAEDPYTADVGSNPTDNWYWFIGTRHLGASTMTYGIAIDIEIQTFVDLFDRKVLSDPSYLSTPKAQTIQSHQSSPYPMPIPVYNVPPPLERKRDQ